MYFLHIENSTVSYCRKLMRDFYTLTFAVYALPFPLSPGRDGIDSVTCRQIRIPGACLSSWPSGKRPRQRCITWGNDSDFLSSSCPFP